jgi:hypothetical protein
MVEPFPGGCDGGQEVPVNRREVPADGDLKAWGARRGRKLAASSRGGGPDRPKRTKQPRVICPPRSLSPGSGVRRHRGCGSLRQTRDDSLTSWVRWKPGPSRPATLPPSSPSRGLSDTANDRTPGESRNGCPTKRCQVRARPDPRLAASARWTLKPVGRCNRLAASTAAIRRRL